MNWYKKNQEQEYEDAKLKKGIIISALALSTILMGNNIYYMIYIKPNSYQVTINDKVIALVETEEIAQDAYLRAVSKLQDKEERNIQLIEEIDTEFVNSRKDDRKDEDALVDILTQELDYLVEGYQLIVNEEIIGIVDNEDVALKVLEEIAQDYATTQTDLQTNIDVVKTSSMSMMVSSSGRSSVESATTEIGIVSEVVKEVQQIDLTEEDIETLSEKIDIQIDTPVDQNMETLTFNQTITGDTLYIDKTEILTSEQIKEILLQNTEEEINYTLVEGDNIWDIAIKYGTTMNNILDLNPQIADERRMLPGDDITLTAPTPVLGVDSIEKATFIEKIPADIEYIENTEMYEDDTNVIQKGKDGAKEIVVEITKLNGIETSRQIIQEDILVQEVTTIIEFGTATRPEDEEMPKAVVSSSDKSMFMHPLNGAGSLSSGYGARWGSFHGALDFAAPAGTPIYASASGTVTYSAYHANGYGNMVIIDHGNGYETYYAHNSKNYVNVGDKVSKGQNIAAVGTTGHSTGNHVHFEIRYNGTRLDPTGFLY